MYVAFIMGQGGSVTSTGMLAMASQARTDGFTADVWNWADYKQAKDRIRHFAALKYRVALVGYSLGAGTACAIQLDTPVDLLIALDPSVLGYNYKINKHNTKRSVLWHDSNWLLSGPFGHAGLDLGFDQVHETLDPHLFVDKDPVIQADVRKELHSLH